MRMAGVNHIHAGTIVGKLKSESEMVRGFYQLLSQVANLVCLSRGTFFQQEWTSLHKVMPVASGKSIVVK